MDRETKKLLNESYDLRVKYILDLKRNISFKLLVVKLLIILLMAYLVLIPNYRDFYNLIIFTNKLFIDKFSLFVIFFPVYFTIFWIFILYSIVNGEFSFRYILFVDGMITTLLNPEDFFLWIAKIIGLLLVIQIYPLVKKFDLTLKNYATYKNNYEELERLNQGLNVTIKQQLRSLIGIIVLSYLISILFYGIRLEIGHETAIILPLLLLPILTVEIFFSPNIFTTVKTKFTTKEDTEG